MDKIYLSIHELKYLADQIRGFHRVYSRWLKVLKDIRVKSEDFDFSKYDFYQEFLKNYKHEIERLEIWSVNEYTYLLVPHFSLPKIVYNNPNHRVFIKGTTIGKFTKLQLEIYIDYEQDRSYIKRKEIEHQEKSLPGEYWINLRLYRTLGKLYNTKYKDIIKNFIYANTLEHLKRNEKDYFSTLNLDIETALSKRSVLKYLRYKYSELINENEELVSNLNESKESYLTNYQKNQNPWIITFQWWSINSMESAFPKNKDKTGISHVKKQLLTQYPNLINFNPSKKREILMQLGIYAHQAALITDVVKEELYNEFISYFNINKDYQGDFISCLDDVFKGYQFPYKSNHFRRYVRKIYSIFNSERGNEKSKDVDEKSNDKFSDLGIYEEVDEDTGEKNIVVPEPTLNSLTQQFDSVFTMANRLGVEPKTLYKWLREEKVPAIKDQKGRWRFNETSWSEASKLAKKSRDRINWDNDKINSLVSAYRKLHPKSTPASAKRGIKRYFNAGNKDKIIELIEYSNSYEI